MQTFQRIKLELFTVQGVVHVMDQNGNYRVYPNSSPKCVQMDIEKKASDHNFRVDWVNFPQDFSKEMVKTNSKRQVKRGSLMFHPSCPHKEIVRKYGKYYLAN